MTTRHTSRSAFTLIELVVVITVIGSLAAIGIPIYSVIVKQMKIRSSHALVVLVAQQIDNYGVKRWTWSDPGKTVTIGGQSRPLMYSGNMFALKMPGQSVNGSGDRIPFTTIDGRPRQDQSRQRSKATEFDGPFTEESSLINSGYMGFYDMVGAPIDSRFVNAKRQIMDAWKEPLRIVYAAHAYGTRGFGVWSPGPDRLDQDLSVNYKWDDLRSWEGIDDAQVTGKKR